MPSHSHTHTHTHSHAHTGAAKSDGRGLIIGFDKREVGTVVAGKKEEASKKPGFNLRGLLGRKQQ